MATPSSLDLAVRDEGSDDELQVAAKDGQAQPGTTLAVGELGERAAGLGRAVRQGGVAVEDLNDEPENDHKRGQDGIARPALAKLLTEIADGGLVQIGAKV